MAIVTISYGNPKSTPSEDVDLVYAAGPLKATAIIVKGKPIWFRVPVFFDLPPTVTGEITLPVQIDIVPFTDDDGNPSVELVDEWEVEW